MPVIHSCSSLYSVPLCDHITIVSIHLSMDITFVSSGLPLLAMLLWNSVCIFWCARVRLHLGYIPRSGLLDCKLCEFSGAGKVYSWPEFRALCNLVYNTLQTCSHDSRQAHPSVCHSQNADLSYMSFPAPLPSVTSQSPAQSPLSLMDDQFPWHLCTLCMGLRKKEKEPTPSPSSTVSCCDFREFFHLSEPQIHIPKTGKMLQLLKVY